MKISKQEASNLLRNFFYLSSLQLLTFILPLITLPYLARVIGVEYFGIIAFATAIIVYFTAFVDYGFNYTAVKKIAQNRDDLEKVSVIFCNIMYARLFLLLISIIIIIILVNTINIFFVNKEIILYTSISLIGYVLLPEWFFQAIEKMKFIAFFNLLAKSIFTVLVFVLIKQRDDYLIYPLLLSTGSIISGIFSLFVIFKKFNLKFKSPVYKDIILELKLSFNMFISIFMPNFYNNISVIFLSKFYGNFEVGIFDGGNKFINITQQILTVVSRVFYPFLARRLDKHNFYVLINLLLSISLSIFLFFGAEFLIKIFLTPEFQDSIFVIKLMAISPILFFLNYTYGTGYLVLINEERKLRNIISVCSLLGLVISFIFISLYSYTGACFTLITIRGSMGLITFYYAMQAKKLNKI